MIESGEFQRWNQWDAPAWPLSRHCSNPPCAATAPVVDRVVVETPLVAIGEFRCPTGHPAFRTGGAITRSLVVFPRTSVWICHDGARPFLADPAVTTIYNPGQPYERRAHSAMGDRCDWFAVSHAIARDIATSIDPRAGEADHPFQFNRAWSNAALYVRQRRLLQRAQRGALDGLVAEEEVMSIVADVLRAAYGSAPRRRTGRAATMARRRDLAEAARAELMRTVALNCSVHDIAAPLGASPYHLCRVFRAHTGMTMQEYRIELRLRLSLESLEAGPRGAPTLSAIAVELGFASHSHFVTAMRRRFGETPSMLRADLLTSK